MEMEGWLGLFGGRYESIDFPGLVSGVWQDTVLVQVLLLIYIAT
jgi:hypothetical protein